MLGADAVKRTTLDPCLRSSEGDLKLITNFESWEEKIHRQIAYWSTKPRKYDDKTNSKKNLHILEDGSIGVQVGDIDKVYV
jgi:hypothetical protein